MSRFTPEEIAYLQSQRLARLATIGANGDLHVVPLGFRYNPEYDTIDIGGHNFASSKKYRDALRYGRVALVVDDPQEAFGLFAGRAAAGHAGVVDAVPGWPTG